MQGLKPLGNVALVVAAALALSGCASGPGSCTTFSNPVLIPLRDGDYVWDKVVDVVDNYFTIQDEVRVRVVGDTVTEGRIDTYPQNGATLLEPWRRDAVGGYERLEGTLQTIRRRARVRVMPAPEGFLVEVAVFKDLEDLVRPEKATAGAATFRTDSSLARYNEPVGVQPLTAGWIPIGRDAALEARIISKLQRSFGQLAGWPSGLAPQPCVEPGTSSPGMPGSGGPSASPPIVEPPQKLELLPPP